MVRSVLLFLSIFIACFKTSAQPDTSSWLNPVRNRTTADLNDEKYLPEINVLGSDKDFKRKYNRYLGIVLKVYPFVKLAVQLLEKYDEEQYAGEESREWKKFRKKEMDRLKDEFGEGIKNMTETQGDVLVKLLYRETGMTAYDIINKYMGGVKAFMWQTISLAGGANLKQVYNPVSGDDHVIEIIMKEIYTGKYGKLARPYIPPSKKENRKQKREKRKEGIDIRY